jgi:hypothetical protein
MNHVSPPNPTFHRKSDWISPNPNDPRFTRPEEPLAEHLEDRFPELVLTEIVSDPQSE